jgi:hypothetical protein
MAIPVANTYVNACKLSKFRCAISCTERQLKITKSAKQKAKKYTTSVNKSWDQVRNY